MGDVIYQKADDKARITVMYDDDAESPRRAWDNVATLWSEDMHRRYNFHESEASDVLARIIASERAHIGDNEVMDEWQDINWINYLLTVQPGRNDWVIVPLNMYDHGGLSFSTGGFSCQWDSGIIGFMIVDRERWDAQHGGEWSREAAIEHIEGEVADLNNYHVYGAVGYQLEKANTCTCCDHTEWEEITSCWGYYGDSKSRMESVKGDLPLEYQHLMEGA